MENEIESSSDDDVPLSERINTQSSIKANKTTQEKTTQEAKKEDKPKAKKPTLTERICVMEHIMQRLQEFLISDMIDNWSKEEGEITARKIKQRLAVLQMDNETVDMYIKKYTVVKSLQD